VAYKLDFHDDLLRHPFDVIPFGRTLGKAASEFLSPSALASTGPREWPAREPHNLFRLAYNAVALRYGGLGYRDWSADLSADETPLDQAILALYRNRGQPTRFIISTVRAAGPDLEGDIRNHAARVSPGVSGILGRLVLDLVDAQRSVDLAFRDVSLDQRIEVAQRLDINVGSLGTVSGLSNENTHVLDDVSKSWDEASLWFGSLRVVAAVDRARHALSALPKNDLKTAGFDWKTPLGWIRVRGGDADDIDAADSFLIVDLGGDDVWQGAAGGASPMQPISVALDLSGNDIYRGEVGVQGSGITGVGVLMDAAGNDQYEAHRYAQGVGQFGFGALIDLAGQDHYTAEDSAQGSGPFVGVGILADAAGNDRYDIFADGQGFGGPGGVGLLSDRTGDDVYHAETDPTKTHRPTYGKFDSASAVQGVGMGRGFGHTGGKWWAGGLGALVDSEGNDRYEAGSWSQGAGVRFGTGLLYDGGGDDHYKSGTYWSQGAAAHYAIGVLIDEGGNDINELGGRGLGFAHDVSLALFLANGGNDRYLATSSGIGGVTLNRAPLGMFIDIGGDDTYRWGQPEAPRGASSLFLGSALYSPVLAKDELGVGPITDVVGEAIPAFAYMTSYGVFLDVGGHDTYQDGRPDGAAWIDDKNSPNWSARNIGIGADVPAGTIDWAPSR
jgi:hypothetical protein